MTKKNKKNIVKNNFLLSETAKEVLKSESESLLLAAENISEDFEKAIRKVYESQGKLVFTGIGKSAHIANKIVATLNSTGTTAVFLHAAEAIHGDLGILSEGDVVFCISKSGSSPEIQALLPIIKQFGHLIIGMTANKDSFLAKMSDYIIDCHVEKESCPNNLAPTNSTTVQLALGDAFAVCLMKMKEFSAQDFAKFHPGGALGKNLLSKVSDILEESNQPMVTPETSIKQVIYEISSQRLGATAVVENQKVVGIITDGDLRRMLEKNKDLSLLSAKDIMTSQPILIEEDTLLKKALELLERKKITQLLVVNEQKKYKGIVHLYDILKEGIVL